MAFTSCHDRGSNRLPPDGRASTLATQPLRLASRNMLATYVLVQRNKTVSRGHLLHASTNTSDITSAAVLTVHTYLAAREVVVVVVGN